MDVVKISIVLQKVNIIGLLFCIIDTLLASFPLKRYFYTVIGLVLT